MMNDPDHRNEYRRWTAGHGESRPVDRPSKLARIVGHVMHPRCLAWVGTIMVLATVARAVLS